MSIAPKFPNPVGSNFLSSSRSPKSIFLKSISQSIFNFFCSRSSVRSVSAYLLISFVNTSIFAVSIENPAAIGWPPPSKCKLTALIASIILNPDMERAEAFEIPPFVERTIAGR